MTTPRAVIFDFDGTLVDSASAITSALNILLARRGGAALAKDRAKGWISLGINDLVGKALGPLSTTLADDIAEYRDIYRAMPPDPGDLYPHALETVRALAGRGMLLGICTNKPQEITERLAEGMGLSPYIRAIVGASAGLRPKPSPEPVHEVLRRLGADVADAAYVGDSETDAEAAKAAGVPFLLVDFGYAVGDLASISRAALVRDFRELPAILAGICFRLVRP